jgi:SAM-dependent methyltransferase
MRGVSGFRGTVLDLGCGSQPYRRYIKCSRYISVDMPYRNPTVAADATRVPFADAVFDAVLCTEVIEHIADPGQAFVEIGRVLRPGGAACITAPMTWGLHYEPHDYYRFTKYSLAALAQNSGLKPLQVERVGGVFSLVGVRLSDVLYSIVVKMTFLLPDAARRWIAYLAVLPWNLLMYPIALLLDRVDKRDAICWMILVRKENLPAP